MPLPAPNAAPFSEQKAVLRRAMREQLTALIDRAPRSERLCAAIAASEDWARAACVGMFAPLWHEPDVELLWPSDAGKTLAFPATRGDRLEFVAITDPAALLPGAKGTREPRADASNAVPLECIDLLLVPGAAFSLKGERLGRGGGFYDRLLASPGFRAFTLGVAFKVQLVAALPVEPHDRGVDAIATESGIQRVR